MLNNCKKIAISLIAASALATSASAGVILDFEAGAGIWASGPSGDINYIGNNIDIENDLGLESSANAYLYADFNHFIPIVPNVRIERQALKMDARKTTSVQFGGVNFGANTKTTLDLTQNDIILYWGIPGLNLLTAGIVDINFGLDLKMFNGGIKLDDGIQTKEADLDFSIPMGYLSATVDPPFIPATISASYKTIAYKGSSLNDMTAKVSINLPIPIPLIDIKLDLGYKKESLVIDKDLVDDFDSDITFSGTFFGLSAKF